MKKQIIAVCAVLVIVAGLFPAAVFAQEDGFTETFDDESLPGWERSEGTTVQDGVLQIQPGNFAVKFGRFGDGELSLKLKPHQSGVIFVRYAMQEDGSYALILFEDGIVLEKTLPDGPQELDVYPWERGEIGWLEFQITLDQGSHTVQMDGETILQATDENPLGPGDIGFWVEGEGAVEFDDLGLVAISGASTGPEDGPQAESQPEETAATTQSESGSPDSGAAARMSVRDLINELSSSQANPIELSTFIINLSLSAVLSYILSRVYVHWGSSLSNRRRFAANFILITVTTTFIILVVRSSVALSLGLVGALSIVRFRAAIKEPEELAYLFFAIAIGIGLGDNQRVITVLAMVAAILILGIMRLFRGRQADFNLHVTVVSQGEDKVELETILSTLQPHCAQLKLMRFDDSGAVLESSFLAEFRSMEKLQAAKNALRQLSDSLMISFLDNKGIG